MIEGANSVLCGDLAFVVGVVVHFGSSHGFDGGRRGGLVASWLWMRSVLLLEGSSKWLRMCMM